MMRPALAFACASAVVVCVSIMVAAARQPQAAQTTNISLAECMTRGEAALRQGRYAEAKSYFERAEKLPGANAAEVNAGLGMAELQLGQYEAARQRETKVLEVVRNAHERAEAHNLIGTAWVREATEGINGEANAADMSKVGAAVREFQQAVAIDPVFDAAWFNLGNALALKGAEKEAAAAFRRSVEAASRNPATAAGLPLVRQGAVPEFSGTDIQGRAVSRATLRGRFVLLDFWATWCAPCIHALPIVRELARYFPQEEFEVVSIDEDAEQETWRSFVAQQKMEWEQVWDKNSDVYYGFGFAPRPEMVIPRYVFMDREGFVLRTWGGTDRVGLMAGQIVRTVNGEQGAR